MIDHLATVRNFDSKGSRNYLSEVGAKEQSKDIKKGFKLKHEHLHESFFIRHKSKVVGFSRKSEIIGGLKEIFP